MCYMSVLPFCSKRKWRAHISICHMPWSVATICKLPPAPQEQSLLSPLRTFCPRVFSINRHFSQKSALKVVKIHALLWAYRGPRERKDAGHTYAHILPTRSKASPIFNGPPLRRKRASLSPASLSPPFGHSVREFSAKRGTFPRKVH